MHPFMWVHTYNVLCNQPFDGQHYGCKGAAIWLIVALDIHNI